MKPRNVTLLVICLAAAGIVVFGLIRDGQRKRVAVDLVNGATNTDAFEDDDVVSTCALKPEDVPNVPKGWKAQIIAEPCIGFGFPSDVANIDAYRSFTSDSPVFTLQDSSVVTAVRHELKLIVEDTTRYDHASDRCVDTGDIAAYSFCYDVIKSKWRAIKKKGFTAYFPPDSFYATSRSAFHAAAFTDDNRFLGFTYRSDQDDSDSLIKIMDTLTLSR